jgi:biopolymer transport protein ExbD
MIVPLIDIIFLLLLFFVMTTTFDVKTRMNIQLPKPDHSQAQDEDPIKNIVINCEYGDAIAPDGSRARYRFGSDPPEELAAISARLAAAVARQSDPTLTIRADRRLAFREIRRVMEVATENRVPLIQVSMVRGR